MVTLKTLIHLPRKNLIREYVMPVIDCDVSNNPSIRWEDDVGADGGRIRYWIRWV